MHFSSLNFKEIFVKRTIPVKTAAFVDPLVEVTFVNVKRDGKETTVVVRTQYIMYFMNNEGLLKNLYKVVQYVFLFKDERDSFKVHMTDTIKKQPFYTFNLFKGHLL